MYQSFFVISLGPVVNTAKGVIVERFDTLVSGWSHNCNYLGCMSYKVSGIPRESNGKIQGLRIETGYWGVGIVGDQTSKDMKTVKFYNMFTLMYHTLENTNRKRLRRIKRFLSKSNKTYNYHKRNSKRSICQSKKFILN